MDLAVMIYDVARKAHKADLMQKTYVLEVSYFDGIDNSASKGVYIYIDPRDPNVIVLKYDHHEYRTRSPDELWMFCDMVVPSIIAELSVRVGSSYKNDEIDELYNASSQTIDDVSVILSSTQYLGVGLHKLSRKTRISIPEMITTSSNVIAFFYHYFDSQYTAYDVLNAFTWENESEFTRLKSLLHSMQRLLVMGVRRSAPPKT